MNFSMENFHIISTLKNPFLTSHFKLNPQILPNCHHPTSFSKNKANFLNQLLRMVAILFDIQEPQGAYFQRSLVTSCHCFVTSSSSFVMCLYNTDAFSMLQFNVSKQGVSFCSQVLNSLQPPLKHTTQASTTIKEQFTN